MKITVPEERRITLELDGRTVAMARGFRCAAARESHEVRAFGEAEPVAVLRAAPKYRIELSCVTLCGVSAQKLSFAGRENFVLAIAGPDKRIVYSGCEWEQLSEQAEAGNPEVLEKAVFTAAKRVEESGGA